MQANFNELNSLIAAAQRSATKLEGGCKAESARCRSALGDASKIIAQLRKDVLAHVKSLPTKSKGVKKVDVVVDPVHEELPPEQPKLVRQTAEQPDPLHEKKPKRVRDPKKKVMN